MFRKSVSFFILVALFWVLLWVYFPDKTPDSFSIGDIFRGMFLLFSFLAAGFALLMLFIRYNGLDMIVNMIPHGALGLWLGKNAYQYSQPKVLLNCTYQGTTDHLKITLSHSETEIKKKLKAGETEKLNIGIVKTTPTIQWLDPAGHIQSHELDIMQHVKKFGKNLHFNLIVKDDGIELERLEE
ncbi:MAG: hypothetical protein R3E90_03375 [Marinicella sp.]